LIAGCFYEELVSGWTAADETKKSGSESGRLGSVGLRRRFHAGQGAASEDEARILMYASEAERASDAVMQGSGKQ